MGRAGEAGDVTAAGPAGGTAGGGGGGVAARGGGEFESRGVERFALFSDAVMAIAITLLAIELPVPSGDSASALWASVRHEDGHYVAFLISFAVIAASWSDHYDLFRCIARVDARLRVLNSAWLLMIVLNPFATRLLTAKGHPTIEAHALRFGFYALLQVLDALLMLAMVAHMRTQRQAPDTPPSMLAKTVRESYAMIVTFGVSIPLFFVIPQAWVIWFVLPVAVGGIRQRERRWRHRHGTAR
jgi:uncharacterized membrane protein